MMQTSAGFNEPTQARSRETLERIIEAVEALLAAKGFDAITIPEIVRSAGCSTGSFYARFDGKAALLPVLYARYDARLSIYSEEILCRLERVARSFEMLVAAFIGEMVDAYERDRNLLRAMSLFVRNEPDAVGASILASRRIFHDLMLSLFEPFQKDIAAADWRQAVRQAQFFAACICREQILFGAAPHAAATGLTNDSLKRELARATYAYLTLEK